MLMVIDTSAFGDSSARTRARSFMEAIESADLAHMSVASFVETSIAIECRYGAQGLLDLDRFISRASIELIPVDSEQALGSVSLQPFRQGRSSRRAQLRRLLLYAAESNLATLAL